MPVVNVRMLELKSPVTTMLLEDGATISIEHLHSVWIYVRSLYDGAETQLRFAIVGNRLRLYPDSYTPAIKEVEAQFKRASHDDQPALEWFATFISEPLPSVGRFESSVANHNDGLEVNAFGAYGLPGTTHDVVLGSIERMAITVPSLC